MVYRSITAPVFALLLAAHTAAPLLAGSLTITTYNTGNEGHLITFPDGTTMSIDAATGDVTTRSHFHSDHGAVCGDPLPDHHRNNRKPGDILYNKDGVIVKCVASNEKVTSTGWTQVGCDSSIENANSMALLVSYGGFDYLFTGDMYGATERPLGEELWDKGVDVDVVKVSHHGTYTNDSSSLAYFDSIQPEYAVIAGSGSKPYESTLQNREDAGVQAIYYAYAYAATTFENSYPVHRANSNVVVSTDGSTFTISGGGFSHGPYLADSSTFPHFPTAEPVRLAYTSFEGDPADLAYTINTVGTNDPTGDDWGVEALRPRTGTYSFAAEDCDNVGKITFGPVPVAGKADVRMKLHMRTSGNQFENDEWVRAYVKADGVAQDPFLEETGGDLDTITEYREYSGSVPAGTDSIEIVYEVYTNANNEIAYLDDVEVTSASPVAAWRINFLPVEAVSPTGWYSNAGGAVLNGPKDGIALNHGWK